MATASSKDKTVRPVELLDESKTSKFNVGLQCGDCAHFKGAPHPKFDAACSKRGVGSKMEAPLCFTPDVTAFRTAGKDVFPMVAGLLSILQPRQSRILMGLLKYAGTLEKAGLSFLEVVYFSHASVTDSYLEDYVKGYALCLTRTGQVVLVGSDYLGGSSASMIAYLDKGSVLRESVFLKRKEKLLDAGRVHRLKTVKHKLPDADYVVPTIDDEPNAGVKTAKKRTSRSPKYNTGDFTIET
jgi:hypothetical protein